MRYGAFFVLIFFSMGLGSSCSEKSDPDYSPLVLLSGQSVSGTVQEYGGTSSPGDAWIYTINRSAGQFTARNLEPIRDMSLAGRVQVLQSGFLKFTVTSATASGDEAIAPAVASEAYGLEVPGAALIVAPIDPETSSVTRAVVLVDRGSCPKEATTVNWVEIAFDTGGTVVQYGDGTATPDSSDLWDVNVSIYDVDTDSIVDGSSNVTIATDGVCKGGTVEFPAPTSGTGAVATMSASGGMALDLGTDSGGVVGFPENSLTLSQVLGREYLITLFNFNENYDAVHASLATCDVATNSCDAKDYADLESRTFTGDEITLQFDSLENGLLKGSISGSEIPGQNIRGAIQESGGHYIGVLAGNASRPFFLVFVSKE